MSSPRVSMSFLTKIQPIWFSRLASHSKNEQRSLLYRLQLNSYFFLKQKLLQVIIIFWAFVLFFILKKKKKQSLKV